VPIFFHSNHFKIISVNRKGKQVSKKLETRVCNICGGDFKVFVGNKLDKRCPGCKFLGLSKRDKSSVSIEGVSYEDCLKYYHGMKEGDVCNGYEDYLFTYNGLGYDYEASTIIDKMLSNINEREQAVIRMRFGLLNDRSDRTLEEVGNELNQSREKVRQIEASGLNKLKRLCLKGENEFKEYFTLSPVNRVVESEISIYLKPTHYINGVKSLVIINNRKDV
jgi:hypothetical protein